MIVFSNACIECCAAYYSEVQLNGSSSIIFTFSYEDSVEHLLEMKSYGQTHHISPCGYMVDE